MKMPGFMVDVTVTTVVSLDINITDTTVTAT